MIKVGKVNEEEKLEIRNLFERKNSLHELMLTVSKNNNDKEGFELLYEKIIQDIGNTNNLFNSWWRDKAQKYSWQSSEDSSWSIDFDTNEIYLIKNRV